ERSTREAERARARLLREAKAMARVSHPNVVSVHEAGTFEDRVYIVMDFIDGTTLTEWLTDRERTRDEILAVFRAAARGLIAAHDAGLVHRDFKPGNVLVARDGTVKVTDFGLARELGWAQRDGREMNEASSAHDTATVRVDATLTVTG